MKHLLAILAALLLCSAPLHAQTIKSLGYNTTNGNIVAATNVVWTNSFSFSTNTVSAQVRTNLNLGWSALTNSNSATSLLGFTANGQVVANTTNTLTFTNAIAINGTAQINTIEPYGGGSGISILNGIITDTNGVGGEAFSWGSGVLAMGVPISFATTNIAATTRTNLGLPLAALTNTSNVTMMRALSGSTNTNHPYSGSISVVGTNNTNTLVFSNGILQSVQ